VTRNLFSFLAAIVVTPVLVLGAGTAARAADSQMPAAHNWTGCYLGPVVGFQFADTTPYDPVNGTNWTTKLNINGPFGGGTIGCNYEKNNWVFGIEGDGGWEDIDTSSPDLQNLASYDAEFQQEWLVTLRGRVGYAWNNVLLYATGGGAMTGAKFSFFCIPGAGAGCHLYTASKTVTGWTVGAGLEYALDNRWTIKAEWLYLDFGTPSITATDVTNGTPTNPAEIRLHENLVRVGLNYRFWAGH
jgi:outer membrane immunogenic protein